MSEYELVTDAEQKVVSDLFVERGYQEIEDAAGDKALRNRHSSIRVDRMDDFILGIYHARRGSEQESIANPRTSAISLIEE